MAVSRISYLGASVSTLYRRAPRLLVASVLALALTSAAACGDDDDPEASDDTTSERTDQTEASAEPTALDITLTETAIEGAAEEIPSGLVELTITDETEGAGGEVSITHVEEGTDSTEFVSGLTPVFDGGAFPAYFLNNAGVTGSGTVVLEPGEYIVWFDKASELDRPSTADDIVTAPLTVTEGDDAAELPAADGTVTSTDYEFAVDVTAGASTVNFVNESQEQFHNVEIVDFGANDPQVIEDNLQAILEAEDPNSLPPGVDGSQINFDFGGSGVFGPGGAGTFDLTFEEGNTYVGLCFIQDRDGGASHAEEHDMYEVFRVDAG
jgi:hypothetical protein